MPDNPACTSPDPATGDVQAGFEEANLLAAGEIFRTYGPHADPVREQITGEVFEISGQPSWMFQATYTATLDGQRRSDDWTLWIGLAGNQLTVLCAQGPTDIEWPPPDERRG